MLVTGYTISCIASYRISRKTRFFPVWVVILTFFVQKIWSGSVNKCLLLAACPCRTLACSASLFQRTKFYGSAFCLSRYIRDRKVVILAMFWHPQRMNMTILERKPSFHWIGIFLFFFFAALPEKEKKTFTLHVNCPLKCSLLCLIRISIHLWICIFARGDRQMRRKEMSPILSFNRYFKCHSWRIRISGSVKYKNKTQEKR